MKSISNLTLLLGLGSVITIPLVIDLGECPFKTVLHVSCPACGMTRAFHALFDFNLPLAFHYNILSIPLFLFIIYAVILLIIGIIKNKDLFLPTILRIFEKYHIIIIVLLILSMIVNNIKGI